MTNVSLQDLLEAGVHFGHQTKRWNPKMKKFIFGARNGIYIIDLQKTQGCIKAATSAVKQVVSQNEGILFVGTKKQAKVVMQEEAVRCGMYYVTERWLGGMLTNFETIRKNIKRLKDLDRMQADGTFEKFTKKEQSSLEKDRQKLEKILGGIKEMSRLPAMVFIVDVKKEKIAVAEARKLKLHVVAMVDTNSDPDEVDFPIPANDDAMKSIQLITRAISDAVIDARPSFQSPVSFGGTDEEETALPVVAEVTEP